MKIKTFLLAAFFLWTTPSTAQIYNDKYENLVSSMDRAAENSQDYYADIPAPGASEEDKEGAERYEENVLPLDEANERHFSHPDTLSVMDQKKDRP